MTSTAIESTPPRALVVDDHPVTRRVLRANLMQTGWDVAEAVNAYEGLEALSSFRPSVVTLDVIMPPVGAVTSLNLLRAALATGTITVFVVSSVIAYEDRQLYLAEGASRFFLKHAMVAANFEPLLDEIRKIGPVEYRPR